MIGLHRIVSQIKGKCMTSKSSTTTKYHQCGHARPSSQSHQPSRRPASRVNITLKAHREHHHKIPSTEHPRQVHKAPRRQRRGARTPTSHGRPISVAVRHYGPGCRDVHGCSKSAELDSCWLLLARWLEIDRHTEASPRSPIDGVPTSGCRAPG
jgi:hypothetical protein